MKKIFTLLFLFVVTTLIVGAQVIEPTDPPTGWGDIFSNPSLWLGSFAGVSLLTVFLAAFINGLLKVEKTFYRQLTAWIIAIIIAEVGVIFKIELVYTHNFLWPLALIHGFAAGLASNGWFDIPTVKKILLVIEGLFKPKEDV